jgi:predicted dehydrogenase
MTGFIKSREEKMEYHNLYTSENCANSRGYSPDSCVYKKSDLTDMNNVIIDYQNGTRLNYTQVLFAAKPGREIAIFGTNGTIQYNLNDQELTVHTRWNNATYDVKANNRTGNHGGADPRMIDDFMDMVRNNTEKDARLEDGAWALAAGFAAYKSSDEERWIDMKESARKAGIII